MFVLEFKNNAYAGADPGIYVNGGTLDRRGVWGSWELGIWGGNGNAKMAVF